MRRLFVLAALLGLSACKQGEVYDRSFDETMTILKATDVPLHYYGPSHDTDFVRTTPEPNKVEWKVTLEGKPVMRYVALVEPESDHSTRVTLTLEGIGKTVEGMKHNPAIAKLYVATMTEATDSALEARPFDTTRFYPQIAAATMAAARKMHFPEERTQSGSN